MYELRALKAFHRACKKPSFVILWEQRLPSCWVHFLGTFLVFAHRVLALLGSIRLKLKISSGQKLKWYWKPVQEHGISPTISQTIAFLVHFRTHFSRKWAQIIYRIWAYILKRCSIVDMIPSKPSIFIQILVYHCHLRSSSVLHCAEVWKRIRAERKDDLTTAKSWLLLYPQLICHPPECALSPLQG